MHELVSGLERFGLSNYEARAYIALLRRGSQSASEIAYNAGIPRTKAYATLKKLVKKGLVSVINKRPVIFDALSPDLFNEMIEEQQIHLDKMHATVKMLESIGIEDKEKKIEKCYRIIKASNVPDIIKDLIVNSRSSIIFMLDSWGFRIVNEYMDLLKERVGRVKIRMICNEYESKEFNTRRGDVNMNMIVSDRINTIIIDSSNGSGFLFKGASEFSEVCSKIFYAVWSKAKDQDHR